MKSTHITALLFVLTLSTPALATDYRFRIQSEGGKVETGGARLTLGATPTLALSQGSEAHTWHGMRVAKGYLFTEERAWLPLERRGLSDAIQRTYKREVEVLRDGLRLRRSPDTSAKILTHLRANARYDVLEEEGGWVKLQNASGKTGWAKVQQGSTRYLDVADNPVVKNVEGKRSIFLTPYKGHFRGVLREGKSSGPRLSLRPLFKAPKQLRKRVLIVPNTHHSSDGGAFRVYARQVAKFYRGYESVISDAEDFQDLVEELRHAAANRAPFDRMVLIGHGGWDGPVLDGHLGARQVSGKLRPKVFDAFVAAIEVGMTPKGKIYNSSCHAAGTARREKRYSWQSGYRWVHDLAKRTGRTVAGPAGKTSTEWTLRQVKASLDGVGTMRQEVHIARGDRLKIVGFGQRAASKRAVPLPKILDLPAPTATTVTATTAAGGGAGGGALGIDH
jgi:hypothetical protein